MAYANEPLRAFLEGTAVSPDLLRMVADTAEQTGVTVGQIMGHSRLKEIVLVRHFCMYAARGMGLSYPEVGRFFGRDHTTVMRACRKVEAKLAGRGLA